jgi:tetratricopeptide (TPR) repeat protein
MMQKLGIFLIMLMCLYTGSLTAQSKDLKGDAAYYFEGKDYKKAYDLYDKLSAQNPTNMEYKFRLGFCTLNYPDKKARAIELFTDIKKTDKSPDVDYYLAKAYHINYKFDEAKILYTQYLLKKGSKISEEDKPLIEDAKLGIANCNNGNELIAKKIIADIKNIGSPINTEEIEGVPVISADESVMIFTYAGEKSTGGLLNDALKPDAENGIYHEDIFISTKANDSTFNIPIGIDALNTNGNDAAVALSPDGSTLFTFVSNNDEGDLFISTLKGSEWSKPERLNKNINTDAWEGSCSISSDGRYLYFASEKPGGLGGRDLYVSEKVNGDWSPAVNLGPTINTEYNEDAPFIHPDGITLFFSSEGHKSIGGYDIMYSIKQDNNWIEPLSMGIPLNTTEDDRYYVINAQGDRGYFSSNRAGAGGKGKQDIYTVTPGILGERPVLALLKGIVYADDKPVEAKVEITKKITNDAIGPYYSNSKTGKYLMALSPGNGYKIKIFIPGFDTIEEELDIEKLQKFVEIKKDFYVYSPGYVNKKDQKSVKSILDSLLGNIASVETFKNDAVTKTNDVVQTPTTAVISTGPCNGGAMPDFTTLKGKSLNEPANYSKLLEIAGNTCAEGMLFKVQIAAYRNPENYKYGHLSQFGKPEIIAYPDGITRFTLLQFTTLNEAEKARQKIIAKGQPDAWVTAVVNGKRYTLEELIMVDFLGKSVN